MGHHRTPPVTAVLGPTNTGKTHLAVERMLGHSSGMIGFPLRLLAREVYDRTVAAKGADQVALITGEEKIIPPGARYFLCTAESMPLERDVAFLALDEAQMGADEERGHIFTDRLLRARGRDETMVLGSASIAPLIRALLPDADIISRPRFSTLTGVGACKLSRLPKRSAIVAFSTEQVYALGEMLRRQRGGVAVVMGSLSPRTRNAQVAMYQAGEVDYLVATDAIGMGLNMDIGHVAFAAVHKFDGRRFRRLKLSEIGQIAGRAGRHRKDGSFGSVALGSDPDAGLTAEEMLAVEGHVVPALTELKWRNAVLDFHSVRTLIASLDVRPPRPELSRPADAVDLAVLRVLAQEPEVQQRARGEKAIRKLWAACQLPDYRKISPDNHARLVQRLYRHLTEGNGTIPNDWIGAEVARLDNVNGDIDTLAARIDGVRTWAYIAHQAGWLDDPAHWAGRTKELEEKLSDALHERLTQRFVDRRTAVLLRELRDASAVAVGVAADGAVEVDGTAIGTLSGFTFSVDPLSSHSDKRRVMAAAERALEGEMGRRARALAGSEATDFRLCPEVSAPRVGVCWRGAMVATLETGQDMLRPRIRLAAGAMALPPQDRARVLERLDRWLTAQVDKELAPLAQLREALAISNPDRLEGAARGLAVQLLDQLGVVRRDAAAGIVNALTKAQRRRLAACGVRIGAYHIYLPRLLKPEPTRWRAALWSVRYGAHQPLPDPSAVSINRMPGVADAFYTMAGYWPVGPKLVRIDIVERIASALRGAGNAPVVPPDQLICSTGLTRSDFGHLLATLGYRRKLAPPSEDAGGQAKTIAFQWKGLRPAVRHPAPAAAPEHSPFAVLAQLRR